MSPSYPTTLDSLRGSLLLVHSNVRPLYQLDTKPAWLDFGKLVDLVHHAPLRLMRCLRTARFPRMPAVQNWTSIYEMFYRRDVMQYHMTTCEAIH